MEHNFLLLKLDEKFSQNIPSKNFEYDENY